MYVTEKGQGAFGDNRRLAGPGRTELSQALFGCGVPHLGKADAASCFKAELAAVMPQVVNVRRMGCAAIDLAYVAAGRFDAFWERGLNSWDIAAGSLLIREAGGYVTGADGEANFLETGSICCGNEIMHRELLALLRGVAWLHPTAAPAWPKFSERAVEYGQTGEALASGDFGDRDAGIASGGRSFCSRWLFLSERPRGARAVPDHRTFRRAVAPPGRSRRACWRTPQ